MASSRANVQTGTAEPGARDLSTVDALAQLSFLLHGTLERRASEHDVSMIQARLLGILRDRTPSMNELARLLGSDKSSVTGLVDRAERRGLVARDPSPTDGRSFNVVLSDTGRRLVNRVAEQFADDVGSLLEPLTPPQRLALRRLVSRVLLAHASARGVDLLGDSR